MYIILSICSVKIIYLIYSIKTDPIKAYFIHQNETNSISTELTGCITATTRKKKEKKEIPALQNIYLHFDIN